MLTSNSKQNSVRSILEEESENNHQGKGSKGMMDAKIIENYQDLQFEKKSGSNTKAKD
jgi:predicted TIM-barrel enzyme